jgi:transcriptional regulator with XRE-family HTH domain
MKTKIKISPGTKRELRTLGARIREARLRRELPQSLVAERASISLQTIGRIEKGDARVSIGAYAMVLQALGLIEGWGTITDKLGDELAQEQLRKRAPRDVS